MIRDMEINDLNDVLEMEKESFNDHWKKEDFLYEITENEYAHMKVAEIDGRVVGMIGYYILFDDVQITTIATKKEYRGKGIAHELMEEMIRDCNEKACSVISLEVRVSNAVAIRLYESFEFITVNTRKGYYEDKEDAFLMVKALGGNV